MPVCREVSENVWMFPEFLQFRIVSPLGQRGKLVVNLHNTFANGVGHESRIRIREVLGKLTLPGNC